LGGKGYTKGEQEDEGYMEIDNSTAEDDDIDPSCYVLDALN
jgi:hypothetical protein